jgi:hypothetical protein
MGELCPYIWRLTHAALTHTHVHVQAAAQDFIRAALRMEPSARAPVAALAAHPFVTGVPERLPRPPFTPLTPVQATSAGVPRRVGSPPRGRALSPAGKGGPASPSTPVAAIAKAVASAASPARAPTSATRIAALRARLTALPPPSAAPQPRSPATPAGATAAPAASHRHEPQPHAARARLLTPCTPCTPASPSHDAASDDASAVATPLSPPDAALSGAAAWAGVLRVARWVDCSDRYGLGYALSDDTLGARRRVLLCCAHTWARCPKR